MLIWTPLSSDHFLLLVLSPKYSTSNFRVGLSSCFCPPLCWLPSCQLDTNYIHLPSILKPLSHRTLTDLVKAPPFYFLLQYELAALQDWQIVSMTIRWLSRLSNSYWSWQILPSHRQVLWEALCCCLCSPSFLSLSLCLMPYSTYYKSHGFSQG